MSIKYYCNKCKKEIDPMDFTPIKKAPKDAPISLFYSKWFERILVNGKTIHLCESCLKEFSNMKNKMLKIQEKWLNSEYDKKTNNGQ